MGTTALAVPSPSPSPSRPSYDMTDTSSLSPSWHSYLRLGSAGLGVILGILMFPVWILHYGNTAAGLWALLSSLPSAIVLHMHLLHRKGRLAQKYPVARLSILRSTSLVLVLLSLVVTLYYIATAVNTHQAIHPISDSYMIAGVWSFMSFKWFTGLAYFSHSYRVRLLKDRDYNMF